MLDGFQMVARIPYPVTVPKYYAVASEVATMAFLRSSGLPIPEVYGYSPTSDNAAKTEYIFMEFVRGTKLSDVWLELGDSDIVSVLCQLAQLESKMIRFLFRLAEASTPSMTWRRWPWGRASRSRTSASASDRTRDCLCGTAGDHSLT
jgi:aminoglycoside phosphotransferase (APT) family kinase protein